MDLIKVKGYTKMPWPDFVSTLYVNEMTPMYLHTTFCVLKSIVKMGQLYVNI